MRRAGAGLSMAMSLVLVMAAGGSSRLSGQGEKAAPGEGVWANYDFVPAEKVIYFDDFSGEQVGNFPSRMEFKDGNLEIVEWNGARWLRGSRSKFTWNIPLPQVLPDRFTMEFDVYQNYARDLEICFQIPCKSGPAATARQIVYIGGASAGIWGGSGGTARYQRPYTGPESRTNVVHVALRFDGKYVKMYLNSNRIANVPNANLGRSNKIGFYQYFSGDQERGEAMLISNVRIAVGGTPIYEALMAKGRVATQGIYFNSGSDQLRPESTPTLKEIGSMLTAHPELKLRIEGHTDSVGDDAANMTLSQKRAEAVKRYLVDRSGVTAARLDAKGFGETKPAGSNETAEGRQQNRRVELVKL